MQLDKHNGTITFPTGVSIASALTLDEFRALPCFDSDRTNHGASGFVHHRFPVGSFRDASWNASVCFCQQVLLTIEFSAHLQPNGSADCSHYSLDIEAETKRLHDQVLTEMLGKPTIHARSDLVRIYKMPQNQRVLTRSLYWSFGQFTVTSDHDFRGGSTTVVVRYGDRHEKALIAHKSGAAMTP